MAATAVVTGLGCAVLVGTAPAANADPAGEVTVECGVTANYPTMKDTRKSRGTVSGVGPTEEAARADAHRKIWGPYGANPHLVNCHRV